MKLVKTTMDKLLAKFQAGELTANLVGRALEQYGEPCVFNGEKWFAMPGPVPSHLPFWVRRGQMGTLADSQVPDGAPDEVLSQRYGVALASSVNVTIGVPEDLDADSGE